MNHYKPLKATIDETELNRKIEILADMIADALMEERRTKALQRMPGHNTSTPSAA